MDGLPDYLLKDEGRLDRLKGKLIPDMEEWLNGKALPGYMKTTRVVALSKEDGNHYPAYGKIRTIAVSPVIMKVYEKILHQKLQKEIEDKDLISTKQNAYKKNRSTLNNLDMTIREMK